MDATGQPDPRTVQSLEAALVAAGAQAVSVGLFQFPDDNSLHQVCLGARIHARWSAMSALHLRPRSTPPVELPSYLGKRQCSPSRASIARHAVPCSCGVWRVPNPLTCCVCIYMGASEERPADASVPTTRQARHGKGGGMGQHPVRVRLLSAHALTALCNVCLRIKRSGCRARGLRKRGGRGPRKATARRCA